MTCWSELDLNPSTNGKRRDMRARRAGPESELVDPRLKTRRSAPSKDYRLPFVLLLGGGRLCENIQSKYSALENTVFDAP